MEEEWVGGRRDAKLRKHLVFLPSLIRTASVAETGVRSKYRGHNDMTHRLYRMQKRALKVFGIYYMIRSESVVYLCG